MIIRELLYSDDVRGAALVKDFAELFKVVRNDMLLALSSARSSGQIRDIDPLQTFVSIVSIDIFYFLGIPLVRLVNPDVDIDKFEEQRIDHVVDILMNGLRRKQE